jgi:processive 1,2-diacylglycerol beta-glucosyltransferase
VGVSNREKRVMIISASIGGGHVAAGRALEPALVELGIEVEHVDLLDYTTAPFRRLYRQAYFDLVRTAPDLVEWLGRRLDQSPSETKSRQARLRARLTRVLSYHLPRAIDAYAPDLVVHTHFLAPEIISTRVVERLPRQAIVVTDFAAHNLWLQPKIDRYFVAADEVLVHLVSSGVDAGRIRVTGIPIDPRFMALPDRDAARAQLHLPPDRDVLLLMASGMERRTVLYLVDQLRELRWPARAVLVCGRSEELRGDLVRATAEHDGLLEFEVLGFTREMPTLMAAADILIGKPGGLTTSEAFAAGLPFAVDLPVDIAFEVLMDTGDGEQISLGHIWAQASQMPRLRRDYRENQLIRQVANEGREVTITLRPSSEAAEHSPGIERYWGEPIVLENTHIIPP